MQKLFGWLFPDYFFTERIYLERFEAALFYAALVVLQLFSFHQFADVFMWVSAASLDYADVVLSVGLPVVEVLALPFLLSVNVRPALQRLSKLAVLLAPLLWLALALTQNLSPSASMSNTGLLGATLPTPAGWWFVALTVLWVVAAVRLTSLGLPKRKSRDK